MVAMSSPSLAFSLIRSNWYALRLASRDELGRFLRLRFFISRERLLVVLALFSRELDLIYSREV